MMARMEEERRLERNLAREKNHSMMEKNNAYIKNEIIASCKT